jgi:hypothetical protein
MDARLSYGADGMAGLEEFDRVMLWGLRCMAAGRLDCGVLHRALVDLCGRSADQLLGGLLVMVRLLAGRSQAALRLHLPGSSVMSRDERAILSALAQLRDGRDAEAAAAELARTFDLCADTSLNAAVGYLALLLAGEPGPIQRAGRPTVH